ncbi:hypothetical protein CKA52_30915 [Pseudomonas aeruginosa]|nr:hypothetical protein CKA48_14755 [Pseudomonas aeruginosa]RKG14922.1 hypothetical protein CKA52_30915 [Pseudomonas aeruginosa]HBP6780389.1 hypothetical protein [Pseudomonas aeruginosa]
MSWRSESPFTVGFRAYVGFWFHCSPNPNLHSASDLSVLDHELLAPPLLVGGACPSNFSCAVALARRSCRLWVCCA